MAQYKLLKMALDLAELKKIGSSQNYLVFGYFRESSKELLPEDPYYNIQPLIVYTCLAFYAIKREWDSDNINDGCIIDGDYIET